MEKELSKNWVFTEVKVLSDLIRGVSYKKADAKTTKDQGDYLILRGGNIQDGEIVDHYAEVYVNGSFVNENQKILKGDVVIVGSTGSKKLIGKAGIAKKDYENVSFGAFLMVIRPVKNINASFFDYYFLSNTYREKIRELAGGININNIRKEYIEELKFPLPPLSEQNRIVTKLDKLFEQLEVINKSLEKIPVLLKNFRQQVLTQAVNGKLTEEWRGTESVRIGSPLTIGKEYTEKPKDWKWEVLIQKAKLESGHTPRKSKPEYWENGNVPWICLQDIRAAHGKTISETKFMPNLLGIENSSARLLPKGTVCFSRDISVGYTTIMGKEMATTQHFANWLCGNELLNKYLLYSFMAAKDHLTSAGQGTTVKTIYMPALKKMMILLPPISEQIEIVNKVEKLLRKADVIEQQYNSLKEKIDKLPQSILNKAFNGKLVPQLESDGDVRDLVREIEDLKKETNIKTSRKKRKIKL